tara:strand:- start:603 stop:893 length:291 start_codon:yes stop_codon:yes gene_type:complete
MLLKISLPRVMVELALDIALEEARGSLLAHQDNTGEINDYTAKEISRLEAVEQRIRDSRDGTVSLDAEDIATIALFANEWKSGRDIDHITQDMINF